MLDISKTKTHFQSLTTEQKYDQLVEIFTTIKDKNDNCTYIYEKLVNEPDLFDDELMDSVFDDVLGTYNQMHNSKNKVNTHLIGGMNNALLKIREAEMLIQRENMEQAQQLLQNL